MPTQNEEICVGFLEQSAAGWVHVPFASAKVVPEAALPAQLKLTAVPWRRDRICAVPWRAAIAASAAAPASLGVGTRPPASALRAIARSTTPPNARPPMLSPLPCILMRWRSEAVNTVAGARTLGGR